MQQAEEAVRCVGTILLVTVAIKVYTAQPTVRDDSHATHPATWKDVAMAFWPWRGYHHRR